MKTPLITFIEYDLRKVAKKGAAKNVEAWVTIRWDEDDEMQISIGKLPCPELDLESIIQKAREELRAQGKLLNEVAELKF